MTEPRVAACLVVSDEAADLHGCLQSLRQLGELLGQVCVYGVGAPEGTLAFARKAGVVVQTGAADDDAAAARNAAACMTEAEWVLVLEPHERLRVDANRLAGLLDVPDRAVRAPDAISVQVSRGSGEAEVRRAPRLYRPHHAHFVGALDERLVPLERGRALRVLTPGPEVLTVWSVVGDGQGDERARTARREARATAALASLEQRGIGGDDLVTALVERSRARRALGDDDGALADLNRARRVHAGDVYRWRAKEDLATLLIEHRYFDGATRLIDELRADGDDPDYTDWLAARVSAARGQADDAFEILRRLTQVASVDGRVVASAEILTETMIMANRIGRFEEALACCVELVAAHGQARRHGRMLLKLWGPRSVQGLADRLIQAGPARLEETAAGLADLAGLGPEVAVALRDARAQRPAAVRIM